MEAHARNSETPLQINHLTDVVTKDDIEYLAIPLSSTNASTNDKFQNTVECGIHSYPLFAGFNFVIISSSVSPA